MMHFIKTVDDIHEALVGSVPDIKFGLGFCEASGERLVRWTGTDDELIALAKKNANRMACGLSFCLFLGPPTYPIHIFNSLKMVPEAKVCRILFVSANKVELWRMKPSISPVEPTALVLLIVNIDFFVITCISPALHQICQ
jgi:adenosine/AMP kinase